MKVNRSWLNWGVFFIVLGAIPLAANSGYLDRDVAGGLFRLWPLLLIGIGVGLMLRFTALHAIGGLVVAATFGLLGGALLTSGPGAVAGACVVPSRIDPAALETRTNPFAGSEAHLELELSCARVEVDRSGGSEWVVRANFAAGRTGLDAGPDRVRLGDRPAGFFDARSGQQIQLGLPTDAPLSSSITLNASNATVNLAGAAVNQFGATLNASDARFQLLDADMANGRISMTLNASSATVSLPRTGSTLSSSVTINAAALTLCAPSELGLSIAYDGTLSSENFAAAGLVRSGDTWQTSGFASASQRLELHLSANVSSTTLDRSGGCQ